MTPEDRFVQSHPIAGWSLRLGWVVLCGFVGYLIGTGGVSVP